MKNNNINNCGNINNNNNNQINNTMEVKTMKQITNGTINFNADALNASIIASAIGYEGNGYDGFLFGDDVNFEQLTAYCVLCEANHFETPDNGIEGFARLAQVYYNTVEYRNFTGIGSVQQLREYDEVPEKIEIKLNGWRPEEYVSTIGETYSIIPMNDFDLAVVRQYAAKFNEMQPESIRVSDDDIEAVLDDYRITRADYLYDRDDNQIVSNVKQSVRKDAAREFDPAEMDTETRAVVVSYPCCDRNSTEYDLSTVKYNPNDLCFVFDDGLNYNRVRAYLLVCELNNFAAPGWSYSSGDGLARLAQVYYNTVPAGMLNVSGIDRCGYVLNPDVYEESYHFDLNGWNIGCYIDDSGEVLPIKALTADDYDQIGEYAKQINAMQPERIRLSDDQIDAYIANAKLEG